MPRIPRPRNLAVLMAALGVAVGLISPPLATAAGPPPLGLYPSSCARTDSGYRCMVGPFDIAAGERIETMTGVAAPSEKGFITWAQAGLVDASGAAVEHHLVHLHHAVWLNPYERDMTCPSYDGGFPPFERFFATGKELTAFRPPIGYGYEWDPKAGQPYTQSAPWWALVMHLDGMHGAEDFYVQLDVGFIPAAEAESITPFRPVWLDVRNCQSDPVYDVERGSGRNGIDVERWTYKMPVAGRFIFLGGHLHDGGIKIALRNQSTRTQIFTSRASYTVSSEPWFLTGMSTWANLEGAAIESGSTVELASYYDSTHRWDEVMGIMVGAFVPD